MLLLDNPFRNSCMYSVGVDLAITGDILPMAKGVMGDDFSSPFIFSCLK